MRIDTQQENTGIAGDTVLRLQRYPSSWAFKQRVCLLALLCVLGCGMAAAQSNSVTLSLALSANPVLHGTSPAAIAVIGCTSACGTVTFFMDGQVFQIVTVNADGTITFPPISPTLALGSHTLTVQYSGN